jgi:NADPH:quinone reductase-like Zn-dependent oxidoreductase
MRVVRLRAPGGPEQLALEEADRPQPGPGQALVRVHAAAITRGELEWPLDRQPAIPSYELSGVVEKQHGWSIAGSRPAQHVVSWRHAVRIAAELTAARRMAGLPTSRGCRGLEHVAASVEQIPLRVDACETTLIGRP